MEPAKNPVVLGQRSSERETDSDSPVTLNGDIELEMAKGGCPCKLAL